LRRDVRRLEQERDLLKKPRPSRQGERGAVTLLGFIAAEKANHPVSLLCRLLGVSPSGFHAWQRWAPSPRAVEDAALSIRIAPIPEESRATLVADAGPGEVDVDAVLPGARALWPMPSDVRYGRCAEEARALAPGVSGGAHLEEANERAFTNERR
jgi:hypothetical protein